MKRGEKKKTENREGKKHDKKRIRKLSGKEE